MVNKGQQPVSSIAVHLSQCILMYSDVCFRLACVLLYVPQCLAVCSQFLLAGKQAIHDECERKVEKASDLELAM